MKSNKPTVLFTGANGQLGSVFKYFTESNENFNYIFTDSEILDITDKKSLDSFFSVQKIDYLINCAAYTNVALAEKQKDQAMKINAEGAKNIALVCEKNKILLIHISTDFVFEGNIPLPRKETDPVNPTSIYGLTKLEGEKEIILHNNEAYIIRTGWLYSVYGENFFKKIQNLAKERDEIEVIFDQVGTPTYANDLVKAVFHILNVFQEGNISVSPGIYHYSNEGVISWYDFTKNILELADITCKVIPVESKELFRPRYSVMNKQKIKETFSLEIPYWRDSLKYCISEYLNK